MELWTKFRIDKKCSFKGVVGLLEINRGFTVFVPLFIEVDKVYK